MSEVNYLSILVAAIIANFLGFLWYSPILFGNPWMKLTGLTKEKMEKNKQNMPKMFAVGFLTSLIMSYVLANFLNLLEAGMLVDGLKVGLWAWLGFVATTMISGVLYENKSWTLYAINSGYQLVSLLVMGGLLAVWK